MDGVVISTIVLAIATVVLVLVTSWYAYSAHKILEEQKVARKATVIPKVMGKLEFLAPTFLLIKIENVGRGPAINAHIEFKVTPKGGEHKWYNPLITPGEYSRLTLPVPEEEENSNIFLEKYDFIEFNCKYDDLYGETYEEEYKIDLKEFKKGLHGEHTYVLWEELPLQKIEKHLEKLQKDISNLSSGFHKIKVIAYTKKDIEEENKEFLKTIKEHKEKRGK